MKKLLLSSVLLMSISALFGAATVHEQDTNDIQEPLVDCAARIQSWA